MPLSTINSQSIQNGTVVAADILDGTISSSKLVSANIAGDRLAANTLSNTVFQTGSVENYLNAQSGNALGARNKVINGAMIIDQRNSGSANTPTDADYTLDRWKYNLSQSAKLSVQQDSSSNTVAGFTNSMKVISLSSYSVGSGDYFLARQNIEGLNCRDLNWGTANAAAITLSFWVRSSLTGTHGGGLRNAAADRSYPFTYTIVAADTWEKKIITIPGDTSGTWLTTNGIGISLQFGLGVGSTYAGTAGTWASANYFGASGCVSVVGTNAATWYITGVQLEKGSSPTPFEYRQYGTELALCQRYTFSAGLQYATYVGVCNNTNSGLASVPFPVTMRSTPTMTATGSFAGDNGIVIQTYTSGNVTLNNAGVNTARPYFTSGSGSAFTAGQGFNTNNTGTGTLLFSAEL